MLYIYYLLDHCNYRINTIMISYSINFHSYRSPFCFSLSALQFLILVPRNGKPSNTVGESLIKEFISLDEFGKIIIT